jgi:hypothetical protein
MFISANKLVKLMKKSYKGGGLHLGYDNGNLIINNNHIAIALEEEFTCNTIKAAFVEYLGYIPTEDCYYFVHKVVPNPQSKMTEADAMVDLLDNHMDAESKAYCTPLSYGELLLYQSKTGGIFGIDADYLQIIDRTMIDYDNESEPTGPCYIESPEKGVYWHNDFCTLIIMPTEISNEQILKVLSNLEFHKKDTEKNAAEKE